MRCGKGQGASNRRVPEKSNSAICAEYVREMALL